jgi:hypothetical protein
VYRPLAALVLIEYLSEEREERIGLREDPVPGVGPGFIGCQYRFRKKPRKHPTQLVKRTATQTIKIFLVNLLLAPAFP